MVYNDSWLHGSLRKRVDAFDCHSVRDDGDDLKLRDLWEDSPGYELPGIPVDDCEQISKAFIDPEVGPVRSPKQVLSPRFVQQHLARDVVWFIRSANERVIESVFLHDLGNLGFTDENEAPSLELIGDPSTPQLWKLSHECQYPLLLKWRDPVPASSASVGGLRGHATLPPMDSPGAQL